MTKFTKLNIGDTVASSGGRMWKKLSVENVGGLPAVGISLEDCTWEQISAISAAGKGEEYFKVGDTKSVYLKGTIGTLAVDTTLYVYIIGFNHNREIEGNGITFGTFKTADGTDVALIDSYYSTKARSVKSFTMLHWGTTTYGGWAGSDLRYDVLGSTDKAPSGYGSAPASGRTGYDPSSTCATNPVVNTLMAALPAELRAVMKPITKYTDNTGAKVGTEATITLTTDYLPLLAEFEIFGVRSYANTYEKNKQKQYEYFALGNSSKKYRHSSIALASSWWERSASTNAYDRFCEVYSGGSTGAASLYNPDYSWGLAPIFKV